MQINFIATVKWCCDKMNVSTKVIPLFALAFRVIEDHQVYAVHHIE